jgi:hypothetical protein
VCVWSADGDLDAHFLPHLAAEADEDRRQDKAAQVEEQPRALQRQPEEWFDKQIVEQEDTHAAGEQARRQPAIPGAKDDCRQQEQEGKRFGRRLERGAKRAAKSRAVIAGSTAITGAYSARLYRRRAERPVGSGPTSPCLLRREREKKWRNRNASIERCDSLAIMMRGSHGSNPHQQVARREPLEDPKESLNKRA